MTEAHVSCASTVWNGVHLAARATYSGYTLNLDAFLTCACRTRWLCLGTSDVWLGPLMRRRTSAKILDVGLNEDVMLLASCLKGNTEIIHLASRT
jgi:hypothetical protein